MDASCREALAELERYLDRECSLELETAVARHLADCTPCLHRADFERALRAVVARHCRQAAPSGLLDRVLESLH